MGENVVGALPRLSIVDQVRKGQRTFEGKSQFAVVLPLGCSYRLFYLRKRFFRETSPCHPSGSRDVVQESKEIHYQLPPAPPPDVLPPPPLKPPPSKPPPPNPPPPENPPPEVQPPPQPLPCLAAPMPRSPKTKAITPTNAPIASEPTTSQARKPATPPVSPAPRVRPNTVCRIPWATIR